MAAIQGKLFLKVISCSNLKLRKPKDDCYVAVNACGVQKKTRSCQGQDVVFEEQFVFDLQCEDASRELIHVAVMSPARFGPDSWVGRCAMTVERLCSQGPTSSWAVVHKSDPQHRGRLRLGVRFVGQGLAVAKPDAAAAAAPAVAAPAPATSFDSPEVSSLSALSADVPSTLGTSPPPAATPMTAPSPPPPEQSQQPQPQPQQQQSAAAAATSTKHEEEADEGSDSSSEDGASLGAQFDLDDADVDSLVAREQSRLDAPPADAVPGAAAPQPIVNGRSVDDHGSNDSSAAAPVTADGGAPAKASGGGDDDDSDSDGAERSDAMDIMASMDALFTTTQKEITSRPSEVHRILVDAERTPTFRPPAADKPDNNGNSKARTGSAPAPVSPVLTATAAAAAAAKPKMALASSEGPVSFRPSTSLFGGGLGGPTAAERQRQARVQQQQKQWQQAGKHASQAAPQAPAADGGGDPSSSSSSSSSPSSTAVVRTRDQYFENASGFLHKRGGAWSSAWKRRWFQLKGDVLEYKKGSKVDEVQGHIILRNFELLVEPDGGWDITIRTPNRDYNLKAEDVRSKFYWVRVLSALKEQHDIDEKARELCIPGAPQKPQTFRIPDSAASHCARCKSKFGLSKRKYNCLRCGFVFCGDIQCISLESPKGRMCTDCQRHLCLKFNVLDPAVKPATSNLLIRVCQARDLVIRAGSSEKVNDPYLTIFFEGKKYRTVTRISTNNPVWNEAFSIPVTGLDRAIQIAVFDAREGYNKDAFLGMVYISLSSLMSDQLYDAWWDLEQRPDEKTGQATIQGAVHMQIVLSGSAFTLLEPSKKEEKAEEFALSTAGEYIARFGECWEALQVDYWLLVYQRLVKWETPVYSLTVLMLYCYICLTLPADWLVPLVVGFLWLCMSANFLDAYLNRPEVLYGGQLTRKEKEMREAERARRRRLLRQEVEQGRGTLLLHEMWEAQELEDHLARGDAASSAVDAAGTGGADEGEGVAGASSSSSSGLQVVGAASSSTPAPKLETKSRGMLSDAVRIMEAADTANLDMNARLTAQPSHARLPTAADQTVNAAIAAAAAAAATDGPGPAAAAADAAGKQKKAHWWEFGKGKGNKSKKKAKGKSGSAKKKGGDADDSDSDDDEDATGADSRPVDYEGTGRPEAPAVDALGHVQSNNADSDVDVDELELLGGDKATAEGKGGGGSPGKERGGEGGGARTPAGDDKAGGGRSASPKPGREALESSLAADELGEEETKKVGFWAKKNAIVAKLTEYQGKLGALCDWLERLQTVLIWRDKHTAVVVYKLVCAATFLLCVVPLRYILVGIGVERFSAHLRRVRKFRRGTIDNDDIVQAFVNKIPVVQDLDSNKHNLPGIFTVKRGEYGRI